MDNDSDNYIGKELFMETSLATPMSVAGESSTLADINSQSSILMSKWKL